MEGSESSWAGFHGETAILVFAERQCQLPETGTVLGVLGTLGAWHCTLGAWHLLLVPGTRSGRTSRSMIETILLIRSNRSDLSGVNF
jgi:hypothetical protein